jgi:membrane protease YdiL (CAAX protease family)
VSDPAPPITEPPDAAGPTLTATVIAPGWALVYGAGVLLFNVALQAGARSEALLVPLRALVSSASVAGSPKALAVALLSGAVSMGSYALMLLPALAMAVTARRRGVRFAEAVGLRGFRAGQTARLSALIVVGGLVGTGVYSVIAGALGAAVRGNTAELVAGFGSGPAEIAIVFVLVGIVAPFVEEITFRGIVFPSLKAAWGTAPALLVSGGIFGVVHLQPTIAVPLALIGMALAAVFMRTRSLWSAIVAHCAFNTVSLVLAFLLTSQVR